MASFPQHKVIPVNSIGAILIAGLLGGPLAMGYLVRHNFIAMDLPAKPRLLMALLVLSLAIWLLFALGAPPDAISRLLGLLPQLLVWWLVVRRWMRKPLLLHRAKGGEFTSKWHAVKVGVVVNVGWITFFYLLHFVATA